jgi:hypothetical protein
MKKSIRHWSLGISRWSLVKGRSWSLTTNDQRLTTFFTCLLFLPIFVKAQSVGYYPWNGLLSVSSNPSKAFWLDARLQTNTLFGSLSTEILPMVNVKQKEAVQYYVGGGVRFNFIGTIAGVTNNIVEGYSLNLGARIAPIAANRNIKIVFELSPYVERRFDSGILKSNFGVAYVF